MPQKHHEQAAHHNEEAAKHHRKAAKNTEQGNFEKAGYHAHQAHGHQVQANEHANEASKKHVENATNRMGRQMEDDESEENAMGQSKTKKASSEGDYSKKK
jgi:hypothetical protein